MPTDPISSHAPFPRTSLRHMILCCVLLVTGLLTACPLTGRGGTTFEIRALASEPAEIRLAAGQSAEATLSYAIRISGGRYPENSFSCAPETGVPGGLVVVTEACGSMAAFGLDFDSVVTRTVALQALSVPAGSYELEFPATLCANAEGDPSIEPVDRCGTAIARLRVVVTDAPSLPSAWQSLGEVLNLDSLSDTDGVQMVVDAEGRPLAAWVENERVVVRRWDGLAWQTLGTPGGVGARGKPALAIQNDGTVVVAWAEDRPGSTTGATQVQSRRWDGTAWYQLVPAPMSPGDVVNAFDPVLLAIEDTLYVAWIEQTAVEGGDRIVLNQVCCGRWDKVLDTRALSAPGRPSLLALAASSRSEPALAWKDELDGRVKVVQVQLGEAVAIGDFPALNSHSIALMATATRGLLLAIAPSPPVAQFQVQRFAEGAWSALGAPLGQPGPTAGVQSVALGVEAASGAPLLAWSQYTASQRYFDVRRWGGSDWLPLGVTLSGLPPQARSRPGTPVSVAITGGARPLLATEVSTSFPNDRAIRVQEFR